MSVWKINKWIGLIIFASTVVSCTKGVDYFPKPLGYHRISFPDHAYVNEFNQEGCPFTYKYSKEAFVLPSPEDKCNHNLFYPRYKATLYASYVSLDQNSDKNNLFYHTESSRNLVYEHTIKADKIDETLIENDSTGVYGVTYNIAGNVASNYQFFLTDTMNHFFRGALYFETTPNIDSIQPILDYIRTDLEEMVATFKWKK